MAATAYRMKAGDAIHAGFADTMVNSEDVAELKIADAIDRLRQSIEHQHESAEVAQIRSQQRTFLKANQKFPDMKALADYVHSKGRIQEAVARKPPDGHAGCCHGTD